MTTLFVTPQIAQQKLTGNLINRTLSPDIVERYALDMLAGRWRRNNNAIGFTPEGELLDGQHRLSAVVRAAEIDPAFKGVDMEIVDDLNADARRTIDIGRKRSIGDVLHMEGRTNGVLVGATAKIVMNYLEDVPITTLRGTPELHDFINANPDLWLAAERAARVRAAVRPAPLAAVLFLGSRVPGLDTHAEAFARPLGHGADMSVGDPRLALRETIARRRTDVAHGGHPPISWVFAAIAQSWNSWITQRSTPRLHIVPNENGQYTAPNLFGAPPKGVGLDRVNDATLSPKVRQIVEETNQRRAGVFQGRAEEQSEYSAAK